MTKSGLEKIFEKIPPGLKWLLVFSSLLIVIFIFLNIYYSFIGQKFEKKTVEIETLTQWHKGYLIREAKLGTFLENHGTTFELILFYSLSDFLYSSSKSITDAYGKREFSLFSRFNLALHYAFLHIGFILLSCLRGWISAILFTFYIAYLLRNLMIIKISLVN